MLSPETLLNEPERVIADFVARGMDPGEAEFQVGHLAGLIRHRREIVNKRDQARARANQINKEVGLAYRNKEPKKAEILKEIGTKLKAEITKLEQSVKSVETLIRYNGLQAPNILHPDVPAGNGEEDNREIRRSRGHPIIDDLDHLTMGEAAGFRIEEAVTMSGTGFAAIEGDLARLERAIYNFFLDIHTEDHGYTEVTIPYIVKAQALEGTGQLPKFEKDMFKVDGFDHSAYLIPTGEVPLTNLFRGRTFNEEELPIKVTALTPCFRAEAGGYGQNDRGLIRQHQFNKVELVQLTTPEMAEQQHQEMLKHVCKMLDLLRIPYRVVLLCSGDTSFAAHKCYDVEVWLPSQKRFREISSVSQFGDFQARRMGITYRPTSKGKNRYIHTLNGSGLAVGRTLVAVMENYFNGKWLVVPSKLIPYMGGKTMIKVGNIKRD